jgi:hypothetical protein
MKFNYRSFLMTLIAVVIFGISQQTVVAQSGSELLVRWDDPVTGLVKTDALRDAIANDANRPADRVYKLQKGGFYWLTEPIQNDGFHLRIVGEAPGASEMDNPALLQMVARADGSVNGRMITGGGSITLKNLYIVGADNNGVQTYYQPIQIDASDSRFVFDNVILERTNFALIAFTGKNNDIFFTNCKFRNLIGQPSTQQWEGRGISIWADQDTVVVENSTFFHIGFTALQIEGGAANYLRFNHNTLVNVGRSVNTGAWFRTAYFANNLLINQFWHGEGKADYDPIRNPNREGKTSGFFGIAALPSKYGPEEGRRILFSNAAAYMDPAFKTYYGDTIRTQYFINEITAARFVDTYDNMVVKDTTWLSARPDFKTYTSDVTNLMIQNIKDLRAGVNPATAYFWKLPTDALMPSWPLPEDFSYTTSSLLNAGTDGLPLGDLNWFPAKKADFETNKDAYIAAIEKLAGPVVQFDVVKTYEAEDATLAGGAAISKLESFAYFQMDGGGFIEWKFNLAAAGEYDLNCWTHLRGNGTRGQRIIVNGVSIHDPMGWGEYIWSPSEQAANLWYGKIPNNEWAWTLIKQAEILEAGALSLKAGENIIRVESSWGYQNFAGFDVMQGGAVVKSLRAADVTSYDIVKPVAEGAIFTPQGFKSVKLGTNGSISMNFEVPSDGKYRLQFFYQNPGTDENVEVQVDGKVAIAALALTAKTDSTATSKLSGNFTLTKGTHSLKITGNNVNLDFIQVIKETSTSIRKTDELPNGYALDQNYPNPFNPSTTINFSIAKAANVKLNIYDILGQKVASLVDNFMTAGSYQVKFNANGLASGIYFYGIEAGDFKTFKKMMLLK